MTLYLNPLILTMLSGLIAAVVAMIASAPGLDRKERIRAAVVVWFVAVLWLPMMVFLSSEGVFLTAAEEGGVAIPLAVFGPPAFFLLALGISPAVRRAADGLDQRWLVGLQGLRVMGGVFLALWAAGGIPWEFALPAGTGDVAVGLIAFYALSRAGAAGALAWIWRVNVAGLADFALAVGTGLLTSPGVFQALAFDRPNAMIQQYPLGMIPVFAVPVFIILHILSLRLLLTRVRGGRIVEI